MPNIRTRLRQLGLIDGKFNRHGATHPGLLAESEFLDADQLQQALRSNYFDSSGKQIACSRTTPATYPDVPLGAWQLHADFRGLYGRFIDQLVELDPHQLVLPECDYTDPRCNPEGRRWDAERYASWMQQGHTPPPISANELESGALAVVNGHRRVAAAKMVRQTIRAWLSWTVDTGKLDSQGNPIKTGLTYELAQQMVRSASLPSSPAEPGRNGVRSVV